MEFSSQKVSSEKSVVASYFSQQETGLPIFPQNTSPIISQVSSEGGGGRERGALGGHLCQENFMIKKIVLKVSSELQLQNCVVLP